MQPLWEPDSHAVHLPDLCLRCVQLYGSGQRGLWGAAKDKKATFIRLPQVLHLRSTPAVGAAWPLLGPGEPLEFLAGYPGSALVDFQLTAPDRARG